MTMDLSSKEKASHGEVEDAKHDERVAVSEQNPLDYDKLNYGQNGLKVRRNVSSFFRRLLLRIRYASLHVSDCVSC